MMVELATEGEEPSTEAEKNELFEWARMSPEVDQARLAIQQQRWMTATPAS